MLRTKRVTEVYDMKVFTDDGNYFGDIEESILSSNKVFGWKVRATKGSHLNKVLGGAKGVIVPHQMIKSFGDVVLISRDAIPQQEQSEEE